MATANVTLENQLHSAQKNLLFLQQDHANTLKGLHAEIRRLQQQCTGERSCPARRVASAASALTLSFCRSPVDLTYELTVRSSDPSGEPPAGQPVGGGGALPHFLVWRCHAGTTNHPACPSPSPAPLRPLPGSGIGAL